MIICADDLGLAEDVDSAVLELVAMGRLTAVSCMVVGARPPFAALAAHAARLDIGLHLTLTDVPPVAPADTVRSLLGPDGKLLPFRRLLTRSFAGGVAAADALREIAAQYARFEALAGRAPDFLDGHLHVQQFPGIRDGLIRFVHSLPLPAAPYVRNAYLSPSRARAQGVSVAKCLSIGLPGRSLRRRLCAAGIATNRGFAGIYDYGRHTDYPVFLQRFAETLTDPSGILMTHPGHTEPWRQAEFAGLRDAPWLAGRTGRFPR